MGEGVYSRTFVRGPRFFLVARLVFMLAAPAPIVFGFAAGTTAFQRVMYASGLLLIEVGGVVLLAKWDGGAALFGRMLDVLPFTDIAGLGMMGLVASDAVPDPLYPAFLGLPVLYALLVPKREGVIIGVVACGAYVAASLGRQTLEYFNLLVYLERVLCIPAVAWVVAIGAERQHQRVQQLRVVSNITEALHTSLDAEVLPSDTVEQFADLLGLREWRLAVIETETRIILFEARMGGDSASAEMSTAHRDERVRAPERILEPDDSLTCTSIIVHDETEAVFCAPPGELERLPAEERIVLEAVCRELLVAVENRRLFGETKHLSVTDALTGLYNRRHLTCRIVDETGRSRRFGKPVSLLMVDGDDFKHVNDVHGHGVGDQVLVELADLMRGSVRDVDVVARYGGEEFCLLLPETDTEGAARAAEKLCETVQEHRFVNDVELTVSIGVATYPDSADGAGNLQRAADNALYAAKTSGKSRVCVHQARADYAS